MHVPTLGALLVGRHQSASWCWHLHRRPIDMRQRRRVSADPRTTVPRADAELSAGSWTDGTPAGTSGDPRVTGFMPTVGLWAWTFIGLVASTVIVAAAVSAVNEIMLPLTFAAVLAIIFKPAAVALTRRRVRPTLAAGAVVLGLLALVTLVMVATVQGVVAQVGQIGDSVDAAAEQAEGSLGVDQAIGRLHPRVGQLDVTDAGGWLPHSARLGGGQPRGHRERPHPRSAHHVLPAQGRHPAAPVARGAGRPRGAGGPRRVHRRHLPDPARATAAGAR